MIYRSKSRLTDEKSNFWKRRDAMEVHVSLALSKPPTERHDVDDEAPPPPNRWCQLRKLEFHWDIAAGISSEREIRKFVFGDTFVGGKLF